MKVLEHSIVVAVALLLLPALPEATAAPSVSAIFAQNDDGVTTDLFDVAQGAVVTNSSALFPGFIAEGTFGSNAPQAVEGFRTIFSDVQIATDFIDFQTATPINLSSYRFILGEDGNGSGNRGAIAFRLYASSSSGDLLSQQVSGTSLASTYTANYGSPQIAITDSLSISNVRFFRMEVDRAQSSGPRVFELDGFGVVVPEASSIAITAIALVFLAPHVLSRWSRM